MTSDNAPSRGGRPSLRTPEIEQAILAGLREGTPLAELCRQEGMPSDETWRNWCRADPDLAEQYGYARDAGFDAIAAQILPIIDDTDEDPASRRVRAEYRLKLLAKWDPKRYGERLDVTTAGQGMAPTAPIYKIVNECSPQEAARIYQDRIRNRP